MLDRKYALLVASAAIFAEMLDEIGDTWSEADLMQTAVARAERLLAEIERREKK